MISVWMTAWSELGSDARPSKSTPRTTPASVAPFPAAQAAFLDLRLAADFADLCPAVAAAGCTHGGEEDTWIGGGPGRRDAGEYQPGQHEEQPSADSPVMT